MSRQILQDIIDDFKADDFARFFRTKNDKFQHPNQALHYDSSDFVDGKKLEEITLEDGNLIVCSFLAKQALSERSGKKAQYELGKTVLGAKKTREVVRFEIVYNVLENLSAHSFLFSMATMISLVKSFCRAFSFSM